MAFSKDGGASSAISQLCCKERAVREPRRPTQASKSATTRFHGPRPKAESAPAGSEARDLDATGCDDRGPICLQVIFLGASSVAGLFETQEQDSASRTCLLTCSGEMVSPKRIRLLCEPSQSPDAAKLLCQDTFHAHVDGSVATIAVVDGAATQHLCFDGHRQLG